MRRLLLPGTEPMPRAARHIVGTGVLDMRRRPTHRSELVSQLILGTAVAGLRARGEWQEIFGPDGYRGWVLSAGLVEAARRRRLAGDLPRGVVAPLVSWIREEPGGRAPVVVEVVSGTVLTLINHRGSWWEVLLPGEGKGWVPRGALSPSPPVGRGWPARVKVASRALSYRGCAYLWGGTTSKGFDCSGFIQTVFRLEGLLLPRDAWQQARVSRRMKPEGEAVAGDLLFFGSRRRGNVTHVALSLGEGLFIHARERVRVESLDPDSLRYAASLHRRFLFCGRVLPAPPSRRSGHAVS